MGIPAAAPWRRLSRPALHILISLVGAVLAVALIAAPSYGSAAAHPPSRSALQHHSTAYQAPQPMTIRDKPRWAVRMLGRLNAQRHQLGRRPLTMNKKLILSAHRHNLRMAQANRLSHKLPREPSFDHRITNAGYHWLAVGENIGDAIGTNANTLNAVLAIENKMFHEKPPNDGHRRNILSRTFRNVGIDVIWDSAHKTLWVTQDFGKPA